MTLVATLVSPSFSVLVADRRRSNLETGEQIDDIVKIRRLNNNVAAGYSGCYYLTDDGMYIGNAEQIMQACEHLTRHPRCTVESIAHIYAQALQSFFETGHS